MPRKPSTNNLTLEQMLKKICSSAKIAATQGQVCLSFDVLKTKKGYTDEQANAYILAFNQSVGTPEEQAIRKAQHAARDAAVRGRKCATEEYLKRKRNYNDAQVRAYLEKYKELEGNVEEKALKKARTAAKCAALQGRTVPSEEYLKNKMKYTDAQVKVYLERYNELKGNEQEQAIRKAQQAARAAVSFGQGCESIEYLQDVMKYSDTQVNAYFAKYKALGGNTEEQGLKKARTTAQNAASKGSHCLTKEELKNKEYTDKEIETYIAAYQISKGTEEEQALRKAKTAAQVALSCGQTCPSVEYLKNKRNYTDAQIKVYLDIYLDKHKVTDEEPAIKSPQNIQNLSILKQTDKDIINQLPANEIDDIEDIDDVDNERASPILFSSFDACTSASVSCSNINIALNNQSPITKSRLV